MGCSIDVASNGDVDIKTEQLGRISVSEEEKISFIMWHFPGGYYFCEIKAFLLKLLVKCFYCTARSECAYLYLFSFLFCKNTFTTVALSDRFYVKLVSGKVQKNPYRVEMISVAEESGDIKNVLIDI